MKRVGIVGVYHETNTYSARLTRLEDFHAFELMTGKEILDRHRETKSVIGGFMESARNGADPFEPVPVFSARAWPGGLVDGEVAGSLLDRLREELSAAGPLDGVLAALHGSMVAVGHPDMEADILQVVHEVLDTVPTATVLDLHGNPSPGLVDLSDVVIAYDTYPHTDMFDRGWEAGALLGQVLAGRELRTFIGKVPILSTPLAQGTDAEPMQGLRIRARARAAQAGAARVSLLPGFPYSDVERAGFSVLVVAEPEAELAACKLVQDTIADVEAHAREFAVTRDDPRTAIRRALTAKETPVVVADVADNIGGGSPGDGTALLAELLAHGAQNAVVLIADSEVAKEATELGPGRMIEAEVGAKTDDRHGEPVLIRGRVVKVSDGQYRAGGSWEPGQELSMGATAVIQVEGVTLVVMERATPPFHGEQLTSLGIDPGSASIIAVKGALAWRAAYGDVAREVIEVATPGVCPIDPLDLPRVSVPVRVAPR